MGADTFAVIILATAASIWDIRTGRIPNVLVYPAMLAGFIMRCCLYGLNGLLQSLSGMALPIILLIIFYALKMLGAGDIKLFSAIGALWGARPVLYTMAFSFLAGGAVALVLMVVRKNGRERFLHLWTYMKHCFLTFSIAPYQEISNPGRSDNKNNGGTGGFPFAPAVLIGAIGCIICRHAMRQ